MPASIWLKLTGAVQGEMQVNDSGVNTDNRQHQLEILSLVQPAQIAFDRATAQATGRRFYKPLQFVKMTNKSTPQIFQALATNETVTAEFRFFRDKEGGGDENYFKITLTNARIVTATVHSAVRGSPSQDEVELVFDSITWTDAINNTSSTDTWDSAK